MPIATITRLATRKAAAWFLRNVYFRIADLKGTCIVLMFHRVLPLDEISPWNDRLAISVERFEHLLRTLQAQWSYVDLFQWIRAPRRDRASFAITFDDGWRDNCEYALPLLRRLSAPATVFVTAGMVGTDRAFWFDRLATVVQTANPGELIRYVASTGGLPMPPTTRSWSSFPPTAPLRERIALYESLLAELKKLPLSRIEGILDQLEDHFAIAPRSDRSVMSWDEVEQMAAAGISIGSHGLNHAIFTPLSRSAKCVEVAESIALIRRNGLAVVPIFSFPNGTYDQEAIDVCLEAGYEVMATASINACGTGTGGVLVHRIGVTERTDLDALFIMIFKAHRRGKLLTEAALARPRVPRASAGRSDNGAAGDPACVPDPLTDRRDYTS